VCLLIVTPKI
jgi:H+-translocating diphosphatase